MNWLPSGIRQAHRLVLLSFWCVLGCGNVGLIGSPPVDRQLAGEEEKVDASGSDAAIDRSSAASSDLHCPMTEGVYNDLVDDFITVFEPIAAGLGYDLTIVADWSDDSTGAHADPGFSVTDKEYEIWVPGGAARAAAEADVFSMILCHEFGHYVGGYPFYNGPAINQQAGEPASDYYAPFCLRLLWQEDILFNGLFRYHPLIGPEQVAQCQTAWSSLHEQDLCLRILVAGLQFARDRFAQELGEGSLDRMLLWCWYWDIDSPELTAPFPRVVAEATTLYPYPRPAQCRLDTLEAAALCNGPYDPGVIPGGYFETNPSSHNDPVREQHAQQYFCSRAAGFDLGVRPLCWYRPGTMTSELCAEFGLGASYDPEAGICNLTREFCEARACFVDNWAPHCDLDYSDPQRPRWTKF